MKYFTLFRNFLIHKDPTELRSIISRVLSHPSSHSPSADDHSDTKISTDGTARGFHPDLFDIRPAYKHGITTEQHSTVDLGLIKDKNLGRGGMGMVWQVGSFTQ